MDSTTNVHRFFTSHSIKNLKKLQIRVRKDARNSLHKEEIKRKQNPESNI